MTSVSHMKRCTRSEIFAFVGGFMRDTLLKTAASTLPNMNIKLTAVIAGAIQFFPTLVQAQAQTQAASTESSTWSNLLWGIFPIFIIVGFFMVFIRKSQKPILKRTQDHMARQVQHMERVEQSLDRITKLLEKKD